jgi:subtilisin family serine protease
MLARGPSRFDNRLIEMLAENKTQKASLSAIAAHFQEASSRETSDRRHGRSSARVLPGGKVMRRFLADFLTDLFLPDVHGYLFDRERRRDMLDSLRDRLRGGGEPFIIVGHSLGSVIAYDLLRSFAADECNVELFLTIGSPLGMQEIRDHLGPEGPLTVPDCVQRWEDFADEDDLVSVGALLKKKDGLESYYGANARGVDVKTKWIENLDRATNPHSGTGYLKNKEVRTTVRSVTGQAFTSPLVRSTIANNLSAEADRAHASTLHEVLIQLDDKDAQNELGTLKELAEELIKKIRELAKTRPCRIARIEPPERLRRFVVAKLTRSEIESLRTLAPDLGVRMVWSNSRKQALIATSASAVQALPAQISYGASGRGIAWAVLDTGIDEDHPHFRLHRNVQKQWDCLTRDIKPLSGGKIADPNGHGTHVAGIIAGETRQYDGSDQRLLGMAPEAKLYGYRVLGEDGVGSDAAIIRALDHIADQNEKANRLVIHGVNLSLGSSYDPSIYGCGHTPICQELRRLWRQGVVVVLAAGNEGYATFESSDGEMALNLDLSIGDPANLEEAIAVGSVHKRNPHIYGISFFSSRGPTADGRRKPDCVAPGENIVSALTGKRKLAGKRNLSECFVEMSGTSMAAPHVSGVLAGFLSVRAEFIGEPDKVKLRLLETCTDLKRDPNMQGAGLVNLTRMLLAT